MAAVALFVISGRWWTECAVISLSSSVIHWEKSDASVSQKGKDDDDQNKRFLSFKTKPETLPPPASVDRSDPVRMCVAQSKQPRTPENPVCVEEQHQLGCEASCWWSSASWALELVDYRISRRRFSAAQDRLLTDYQILVYHLLGIQFKENSKTAPLIGA
ncbi:uncharacterized protein CDAR_618461 [Caerostris darwini]|uniref:Uncharacterized protein n=1 Tax=Caerostris darwini TaxID=1538125 RepID=A0AAV4SUE7_9ARAC|nr:uncharacterized protein CDAR_618461 [Caerostris darwini]